MHFDIYLFSHRTNITEEYGTYGSSRGDLVASFLSSTSSRPFEEDVHSLIPCEAQYAGFNLLVLAPSAGHDEHNLSFDGAYVTNHGGGGTITVRPLTIAERRCGGMSNGIDGNGAEAWPKVQHGLHSFKSIISAISPNPPEKELAESLFQLLTWVQVCSSLALPHPYFGYISQLEVPADAQGTLGTEEHDSGRTFEYTRVPGLLRHTTFDGDTSEKERGGAVH